MQSLIGNIDARVDAKGRAFLPAQLRKQLDDCKTFILRKDIFCNCLVLYTEDAWNEIVSHLKGQLNGWNRQQGQIFRQFVSEADRIELEENGRMLIPRRYIDALGIKSDIRFVGSDTTIEIWPAGKIEETFIEPDDFAKELELLMEKNKQE
ncbi:MAG: cell division/cell wall cluster transcriptional repressor MraZ [Paludibacteraceae bacterium]|nr:cell division/cell wall cluster transcriptional repressor MraZ [Paludibacteraceae bacterium]